MTVNELIIKGRTIKEIYVDNWRLMFKLENDEVFLFYHDQECCENVIIDQIDGDLDDLIGNPLLMAEETIQEGDTDWGTQTWTFYRFATIKGYVTVKWHGESNGYYSESVDMDLIKEYNKFTPDDIVNRAKWGSNVYIVDISNETDNNKQ